MIQIIAANRRNVAANRADNCWSSVTWNAYVSLRFRMGDTDLIIIRLICNEVEVSEIKSNQVCFLMTIKVDGGILTVLKKRHADRKK